MNILSKVSNEVLNLKVFYIFICGLNIHNLHYHKGEILHLFTTYKLYDYIHYIFLNHGHPLLILNLVHNKVSTNVRDVGGVVCLCPNNRGLSVYVCIPAVIERTRGDETVWSSDWFYNQEARASSPLGPVFTLVIALRRVLHDPTYRDQSCNIIIVGVAIVRDRKYINV